MIRKLLLSVASAAAATIAITAYVKNHGDMDKNEVSEDNEINFIKINDEDEEDDEEDPCSILTTEDKEYGSNDQISLEIKELAEIYPHLTLEFVEEVFKLNKGFVEEFPDDSIIVLTHTSSFLTHEDACKFKEVVTKHGYRCEVDQDGNVQSSRKLITENGMIISEIYNVANQTRSLGGQYVGHLVKM